MYGLVNRALAEMVTADHGAEVWQEIKQASGIDVAVERLTLKAAGTDHDTFHVTYARR